MRQQQYEIILLGGLSGRLDHTISTLSYLHKLRKTRKRVFAVTDDNVGWVLDAVRTFLSIRWLGIYAVSRANTPYK
jgi:thiamine pyrophosphokinase